VRRSREARRPALNEAADVYPPASKDPSRPPGSTRDPATNAGVPAALKVTGLVAGYGETTVLRDVNLEVPASTVVALLGPNGAGKTTLLRAVSGVLKPRAGHVLLHGVEVQGRSAHHIARQGLCHIPEGRGVFPSLTVEENLILQSVKGEEAAARDRALAAFPDLASRMKQLAGDLSGGEQQMLALARTYLSHADVVVVDEASLGLAPLIVDRVFETLKLIAESGKALLLVEQYVARALAIAERVYILDRGQMVHEGPASGLDADVIAERYLGVRK